MTPGALARLIALGLCLLPLSACLSVSDVDIYDSGSMNADRFAAQTRPVWDRHQPAVETSTIVEPVTEKVIDYQSDDGFPVAAPVSTMANYGKLDDAGHWLPAIPTHEVDRRFLRKEVSYQSPERPGTVVVDTQARQLYLVLGNGRAIRYGVGIGRQGYAWKGRGLIKFKKTWPRWTPSEAYVADRPAMKMFSASYGGLVGGINNPLGARALYIFQDGKDTLYRVHGTPDWKSIGKHVSSGCIRMFNQDVIDLFSRVKPGAEIVVK